MASISTRHGVKGDTFRAAAYVSGRQIFGPSRKTYEQAVKDGKTMEAQRPGGPPGRGPKPLTPMLRAADEGVPTIYFIQAGRDGPIKIGITNSSPFARMATLQIAHYEELQLLASRTGTSGLEAKLHRRLEGSCIRGEWFMPTEDVLAAVDEARVEAATEAEMQAELANVDHEAVRRRLMDH